MPNDWFQFKKFIVRQQRSAMKVTTDSCLFGAWLIRLLNDRIPEHSKALDIGTGTGLLSLMLAQELPIAIDAVEIDQGAILDATENFYESPFRDRLEIHGTAIQEFPRAKKYQLIISNPPFYTNSLKANSSSKNLARHDESLSLDTLFSSVKALLDSGGYLGLLYPAATSASLVEKAGAFGLKPWATAFVCQTPAHEPFRAMIIFREGDEAGINEETITISDARGNYTQTFKNLLKDFYLGL